MLERSLNSYQASNYKYVFDSRGGCVYVCVCVGGGGGGGGRGGGGVTGVIVVRGCASRYFNTYPIHIPCL